MKPPGVNSTLLGECVPLTSHNWNAFLELFGGVSGGCGGCWCTWWRMSRAEWYQHTKKGRLDVMRELVARRQPTGVLLLNSQEAEGWCAVAPLSEYPTMLRSPVCKPMDKTDSWCISCIFIKAPYRRQGKMETLIRGAANYAFSRGAPAVDGFPQRSGDRGMYVDRFVGVEGSFERAGFERIESRGRFRVAMRKWNL